MIQKVILRRFKRFEQIEVPLGEHVVFAGPNNLGKTTVLQAVAAWSLAFSKWRTVNRFSLRTWNSDTRQVWSQSAGALRRRGAL